MRKEFYSCSNWPGNLNFRIVQCCINAWICIKASDNPLIPREGLRKECSCIQTTSHQKITILGQAIAGLILLQNVLFNLLQELLSFPSCLEYCGYGLAVFPFANPKTLE